MLACVGMCEYIQDLIVDIVIERGCACVGAVVAIVVEDIL